MIATDLLSPGFFTSVGAMIGAAIAAFQARRVKQAVQPNGESLTSLIKQLIELDSYTHVRFHDLINAEYRNALYLHALCRKMKIEVPIPEQPIFQPPQTMEGYPSSEFPPTTNA